MTPEESERKERFNNLIAVTIAVLASFGALCKVKDDNIGQAMQQAQAAKIDDWQRYQSLGIRDDIVTVDLTRAQETGDVSPRTQKLAAVKTHVETKKAQIKAQAEQDQKSYDALNYRDDQFDLSDALLSIAIALFAVTSLVQKRWLYGLALVPGAFGVLMGLAGLLGWHIHPDMLAAMLS